MYKLLIVDDEDMLRHAIVESVCWEEIGFLVDSAEDGAIALEKALTWKPDVVLTDIRMPFMDGLELTEKLKESLPNAIVLILSGHDEFSYAKSAVQLGVKKYIEKPIIPSELIRIMRETVQTLNEQAVLEKQREKLQSQVTQALPYLREKFLNRLINNSIHPTQIPSSLEFSGLQLEGRDYTVCVVDCNDMHQDAASENSTMRGFLIANLIDAQIGSDDVAFESSDGLKIIIYCDKNPESENYNLLKLMTEISDSLYENTGVICTCAIGLQVSSLTDISISYQSAMDALQQQILDGRGKIYDAHNMEVRKFYYPFEQIKNLLSTLKFENQELFTEQYNTFFDELKKMKGIHSENLLTLMMDIAIGGQRILLEAGIADKMQSHVIYGELFSKTTLEEYKSCLKPYLIDLQRTLQGLYASTSGLLIEQVCDYIKQNFNEPALSLSSVASTVFVTPTYLSALFKKKIGTTFVEYITRLRMENAKSLLRGCALKTYEIASASGYNDPQYFSSCFKKYTGHTPSEYRNLKQSESL